MAITFRDIFASSDLGTFGTPLTTGDIVSSILFSFATGLFIFYIYKKTYSGVLYSKNFNVTLIMATMVGSVIMMAIGGNLALALGMVGALSIIRFRAPIKDPKDLTFLFWAITAGIVNGIRFYKLSIISSLMIGVVLLVLSKKLVIDRPYVLILKYSKVNTDELNSILKKHCKKSEIRNTTIDDLDNSERTIEVKIKEKHEDQLLKSLKEIKGIKKVMLFSHTGELSE
tara:strand:- start:3067 stop:3750 length:684 start_codon:yes stop_codon:yes gene_type:complete